MTDAERGDQTAPSPQSVGERLRVAREAQGLSLVEIASRTRVPQRHLEAIEKSEFGQLPSVTYAVGFVRSYARALGEDEVALAHDTRIEVANTVRARPHYEPYEIADPKRVPSRALTIAALGVGLALLVLAILYFATGVFRATDLPADAAPPVVAPVPAVTTGPATPASGGQVAITATDEVWMRIYDDANETLYIGTMKKGERFDVPSTAKNPMINVGRPDQLSVTLNGSAVAPLGTGERAIKDVPIGAAALAARQAGTMLPAPSQSTPAPSGGVSAPVPPAFAPRADRGDQNTRAERQSGASTRRRAGRSSDNETARANRNSPQPTGAATSSGTDD